MILAEAAEITMMRKGFPEEVRPKLIACKKKVRVNSDCVGARTCLEHSAEGTGGEEWGRGAMLEVP